MSRPSRVLKPTIALLRNAVRLEPDNPRLNHSLGARLVRSGDYLEALPYLEHARGLSGGTTELHHDTAQCLLSLGRPADAARVYDTSLQSTRSGPKASAGWASSAAITSRMWRAPYAVSHGAL